MRIYKCNRCGTQFTAAPAYSMLRKPVISQGTLTPAAWVDLCPSCTTSFLTWLHPESNNVAAAAPEEPDTDQAAEDGDPDE